MHRIFKWSRLTYATVWGAMVGTTGTYLVDIGITCGYHRRLSMQWVDNTYPLHGYYHSPLSQQNKPELVHPLYARHGNFAQ